jgi:hypothetical protein
MPNRYTAFGWAIDLAPGWRAEIRDETIAGERTAFLAIVPETNDSLLRLTPDERGIMSAAAWVECVGRINRAKGRRVLAVRCGDFAGCAVEFCTTDDWVRGWALCANSVQLDATYRCEAGSAGRDDPVVDGMLSSLRLEQPSAGVNESRETT